jgi:uncharacterized glyoxalase superfamily protein PhnB
LEEFPDATSHSGAVLRQRFLVADTAKLDELHAQWLAKGIQIIMAPTKMYFGGIHFMALDPDGHRLRVATPD